ncbi:hypothetical protein BI084_gp09 [Gordonia phage Terapin]|uniref:Scaffolding protein n=5 Tax=Terapinvirus terapin TaxID=2734283 RepID=A0A345MB49_9CAUD|nr:hypothetical protein BI084_gp09 [Gordonia phage Terapin]AVP43286.1 hypothetical protein PBI_DJOKOVIC_9 [Gordonia phage Djokovic]AXH67720.1 hypothetical protein SEA_BEYONCAGE_9 [Gordonia phage Beyoncage]QOC56154.1 scaffolding protein [Gordonia phage Sienna]QOC56579.1 scaffolding protein [Gordonia phage BiteSize]QYW00812.1 scaffolding protein [Gordonia phage Madi]
MKSTVLRKDIAKFFAFGGDGGNDDPPNINVPGAKDENKGRSSRRRSRRRDDDDDDDDDDIDLSDSGPGSKDNKIYKLSQENKNRRRANRELRETIAERDERIEELEEELRKVPQLQSLYEKQKQDNEKMKDTVREMALRQALGTAKGKDEKPLAWYDEGMVLDLIDRKKVAVDLKDFSVSGLDDQLQKIAEEKPFLVKDSSGEPTGGTSSRTTATGAAPQSSATGTGQQNQTSTKDKYQSRFAALNNI